VTTYREALDLARSVGTAEDVARITMRLAFAMPYGRDEYGAWQAAWDAAEPLGDARTLARLSSGLARRANLYLEDDRAMAWLKRALVEARRAGSPELELNATRLQNQLEHRPGWQEREEGFIREGLAVALAHDSDVLEHYSDLYVRRCREADQAERDEILAAGRAYAEHVGIPQGIVFRYGVVWVNWLTGSWPQARALWDEVRARWAEDAGDIFPDAGPIAAAIDIEVGGPDASRAALIRATAPMRKSETWRGLLAAATHEANLWLAEDQPQQVLESLVPILRRRPPGTLDIQSFALATRVVLPAALLANDGSVLRLWTEDPLVAAGGAFQQAAVDHAQAVAAVLKGDAATAESRFARAASGYLARGWLLVGHELSWQRATTKSSGADEALRAALTFYEQHGASWRRNWLAERSWAR
jgi:hypothetical protein